MDELRDFFSFTEPTPQCKTDDCFRQPGNYKGTTQNRKKKVTIISVDRRIPENDIFIIKPFVNNTYHTRCRSVVQLNEHYTTTTTTFLCPISILQLEVSADTNINPIPSFQVLLLR